MYFPVSASKIILLIAFLTYANVCGSYFLSSLAMCLPNEEYGSVMSVEDFCKHSRASASMISAESSCGCVFFGLCRFFYEQVLMVKAC